MNALWAKYGCTICDAYPVLVLTVNFSDSKSSFQTNFITKYGAKSVCVPKEDGGTTFNTALKNQNYGGPTYLICPNKTVIGNVSQNISATESDIIKAGIKPHVCGSDLVAPTITITAPVSGAVLKVGSVAQIKWTATDNVSVVSRSIYCSTNNGTNWTKVDSATGNTGTFNWTVPNTLSKTCKMQINAYDAAGNKGTIISSTFTIDPATGIVMDHQFNVPIAEKYSVTIMNIQGKQLAAFEVRTLEQIHQMRKDLPSGIHIVNISTPDRTVVTKMKIMQ